MENKKLAMNRAQRDNINITTLIKANLKPDSNCIDIGAHKGEILKQFIKHAPQGSHYAIEPIEELAVQLKTNFPKVNVFNCALSNKTGEADFVYVPEMPEWSGLRKQKYPVEASPIKRQIIVQKLDNIISNDLKVDFIKIDVEGGELEVLKGAVGTINRSKPIILFEHAKIHNENYNTTPDSLYDFIVNICGLDICGLSMDVPFSREEFCNVYQESFDSGYDNESQTNFVARVSNG